MSSLSFLDKLLDVVEVRWFKVGELISPQRGKRLVKSQLDEIGSYAVYQNSMRPLGYYHENNAQAGATFVIVAGAAGEIGFSDVAFWAADDVYFFPKASAVENKYLYHFLLTKQHEISSQVRRASIPRLSIAAVENLEIPIPCPDSPAKSLKIQREIVRILDNFTELTAGLTAELTARKKQYNYYRDQLLGFEDGDVEWKALGAVVAMRAGQHISASKISDIACDEFIYPCFGGNGVRGYVKEKSHEGDYLLIGRQGALCGNVQRMKGKFYATEHAVVVTVSTDVNIDWAFHMLTLMNLNQYASQSAQPGLAVGKLEGLKIPIPALAEQIRIASMLDKFEALTNSLTEGLPREIELRQKQYAYYRDLLLSFPKTEEVVA